MAFELNVPGDSNMFLALTAATGGIWHNGRLELPETLGTGYIQTVQLGSLLSLMIHQYELKQDVLLRKAAAPANRSTIVFSFRNLFQQRGESAAQKSRQLPTVRVSSADLDFELYSPAKTRINSIIIAANAGLFSQLLPDIAGHELLQPVLAGGQPFLYEAIISPEMQDVAAQIVAAEAPAELRPYYLKIKAEELIYLFLAELLKRQHAPLYPLSVADAKVLYQIRDKLLADLSTPPNLPALARFSGLSESKMKRLFRQVFGNTIYNYYQAVRMQEAVSLLKDQRFTVTEVGYQLGFSNLSHFSRLFERHIGFKPKKYSKSVGSRPAKT